MIPSPKSSQYHLISGSLVVNDVILGVIAELIRGVDGTPVMKVLFPRVVKGIFPGIASDVSDTYIHRR